MKLQQYKRLNDLMYKGIDIERKRIEVGTWRKILKAYKESNNLENWQQPTDNRG